MDIEDKNDVRGMVIDKTAQFFKYFISLYILFKH